MSLWLTKSLYWAVGLHAGWDWSQSYLYGVPDSGQVASGHLFATHPFGGLIWSGGPTGPEGSVYMIPTLAVIALGVWIAWSKSERRKEPAAILATRHVSDPKKTAAETHVLRFGFFRVKHLREVCPLSRPVMLSVEPTQPVSAPLQNSIRFLPDLIPASPSIDLATSLPLSGSATGLPCSVEVTR